MVIIETSVFTRQVRELLPDEEYRKLQVAPVSTPTLGSVIRGSGGLRKVVGCFRAKGSGAASG